MIAIEYHADLKEVQADARLVRLLSAPCASAPFDRLAWWQGLAKHCDVSPLIAVASDGDSVLALPLQRDDGQIASLAKWYSFWVRPQCSSPEAAPRLLKALAEDIAHRTHRAVLAGLPDEDGSTTLIAQAFSEAGWRVDRTIADTNHYLSLGGRSFDEFLAARPGPVRTTLKRKSGKVQCRIATAFDDRNWSEYEAVYRDSWKPDEGSFAFLREFAVAEARAGRLRMAFAEADGQTVAVQLWTVEGGTAFIHKLAHRESAKPLSPGTTLSAALFRHVIDTDLVTQVDFGTGDNAYKRDWMEEQRPRYCLEMFRAGDPRNWAHLARTRVRQLAGTYQHG